MEKFVKCQCLKIALIICFMISLCEKSESASEGTKDLLDKRAGFNPFCHKIITNERKMDEPKDKISIPLDKNYKGDTLEDAKYQGLTPKQIENYQNYLFNRNPRSSSDDSIASQFERFCRGVGSQPCTCHYPDHPNVTQFELSTDEITKNASGTNGGGPKNCDDLKAIGHTLKGFYLVRFHDKRALKAVYCSFDQQKQKIKKSFEAIKFVPKQEDDKRPSKRLRFCGGVAVKPCTFFYSDHPDALIWNEYEPKNCEDLQTIGYTVKGFYMVRFNTVKIKTLYCDFNQDLSKDKNKFKRSIAVNKNKSKVFQLCDGFGSQPCSCYYSKQSTMQLELSTDEITRYAARDNGIGPLNCKELEDSGHTLKGFYTVRYKSNTMKIVFCEFINKFPIKSDPVTTTLPYFIPELYTFKSVFELKISKKIPIDRPNGMKSYQLKNKHGKCLAVETSRSDKGAKIIQVDCNSSEEVQLWSFDLPNKCFYNEWNKYITIPV